MRSEKQGFGCVEYTLIIAVCAMVGFILYASIQYKPHEAHPSATPPLKVSKPLSFISLNEHKPLQKVIHDRMIRRIPEGQDDYLDSI